jgi:hypothetical protein
VVKSGKVLAISFTIFLDPKYHWIKVIGDEATLQSLSMGLVKVI